MAEPTLCEAQLDKIIASFEGKHAELFKGHPDCSEELSLLSAGLHTIKQLIHISPPANGNGAVWKELISKAETERAVLRKHIGGKALITPMLRLYAALHRNLSDTVLSVWAEHKSTEEFRQQRRSKRNPSEDSAKKPKTGVPTPESRDPRLRPKGEVPTRNFFAPLRTTDMDLENTHEETHEETTSEHPTSGTQQASSSKPGRPPALY
jgi:hypothetical protein